MKTHEKTPKKLLTERMGPRRSALTMSLAGGLTAGVRVDRARALALALPTGPMYSARFLPRAS